jgi:hypothetical protein
MLFLWLFWSEILHLVVTKFIFSKEADILTVISAYPLKRGLKK